jgi:Tol biopolymer transport system component/DNA-binding winged helix-turn-helix (wHTH) protein
MFAPEVSVLPEVEKSRKTAVFKGFELNVRSGELKKEDGKIIHLPDQPCRILLALLERPGEVVFREEIRQRLWPNNTVVEFEHSISAAMNRLRQALGDSGDEPRYIETLPRRGYRWTAPVQWIGSSFNGDIPPVTDPVAPTSSEMPSELPIEETSPSFVTITRAARRRWVWAGSGVIVSLLAFTIWRSIPVQRPRVTGSVQLTNGGDPCCVMVTDGSRIYFRQNLADNPQLSEIAVGGSDISLIPFPFRHPVIEDISPDRTHLLVTTFDSQNAPFWSLPLPSGSPHRIGDVEGGWGCWALDGKHFLLAKDSSLFIAASDGSGAKMIVSGTDGNPGQLRFSPDGSRIRFTVFNRQARTETLWEVRSDGSDLHQLLPDWHHPHNECCGRWTPDGRYYVFEAEAQGGARDIFALAESRGLFSRLSREPTRLTFGPLRFEAPLVSLDEKKLFVFGWHQRGELVRYDSATGKFIPFLGGISATDVAFSRDGQWIAYVSIPGYNLWRCRVDGTERIQLTSTPGDSAELPRWSPNGKQIAFMSRVGGKPWKTFLISADGGPPKPLRAGDDPEADPTWSSDGTQIAFATGFTSSSKKSEIEIVDTRNSQVATVPGSEGLFSPRWSPDGRHLAALSFEYPAKRVFIYDVAKQEWASWITDEDVGYISWTADSHYLQYVSGDVEFRVRRVKVGSSNPIDVFSAKDLRRYSGISGFWSDATPDGSRMFVRDASGRDIYAFDVDFY